MYCLYKKLFGMSYDIVLVKFSRLVEINKVVRFVCLLDVLVDFLIDDGSKICWIIGILL